MKLGHAVAATDKREPTLNWGQLVKYFWWLMNRDTARSMLLFDAMYNKMRYDPHMAMEDTDSEKVCDVRIRGTDEADRFLHTA